MTALILSLFLANCVNFPPPASAQVLINEVLPAPSSGDEWIELRNTSESSVSLAGWSLEDNTGLLSTTPALLDALFNSEGLAVIDVKNRLNNSGDHLTLRRPDGSVADYFEYFLSATDQSWSRFGVTSSDFLLATPTRGNVNAAPSPTASPSASPSITPLPSPSQEPQSSPVQSPWISPLPTTSSPVPTPPASPSPLASYPLQLSEVMSCPQTNEAEWIEFFNPNSVVVTINNWKVKDASFNSRSLNLTIIPHSFASQDLTSAILNNDGDTATILDQDGRSLISLEIPSCEKGQSTVFSGGSWQQTHIPTKNSLNVFVPVSEIAEEQSSPAPSLSLDQTPFQSESYPSTPSTTYSSDVMPATYRFATADMNSIASEPASPTNVESTESAEPLTNTATESGSVLGDSDFASSSATTDTGMSPQKPVLIGLFIASMLAMSIGGYGLYQWYTELHVESVMEDF